MLRVLNGGGRWCCPIAFNWTDGRTWEAEWSCDCMSFEGLEKTESLSMFNISKALRVPGHGDLALNAIGTCQMLIT
jgi:hypothetical protein